MNMSVNIEESGGGRHIAPKSKHNQVEKFFPVCIDNFFNNPDKIVRYAKRLPKDLIKNPAGHSVFQTEPLWKMSQELNYLIILKILSSYYDLSYQNLSWDNAEVTFKEHPAPSENKNDVRNRGWIHHDNYDYGRKEKSLNEDIALMELAGLIYLTPDIDPDAGTSMYMLKPSDTEHEPGFSGALYKDLGEDDDLYKKNHEKHEDCFIEKTRFANIYNRMIMYDTNEFHRANSYYNDVGKDARLTLVFFIGGLNIDTYPLERPRDKENDEFITKRTLMTHTQHAKIQSDKNK